ITVSIVFLGLFVTMYRGQLTMERGHASVEINRLLQAALENAMLKRDLEGLQQIVQRLGNQTGVVSVMVLNPFGEVRFSSRPEMLGTRLYEDHSIPQQTTTTFIADDEQREVLRSINPVSNKEPCTVCHGPIQSNPVNGVLVVDYTAGPIREHAFNTTLVLMGAGAVVVVITLVGGWWFMRRFVLSPVQGLVDASQRMSTGNLGTRVNVSRDNDEFTQLAISFNEMAQNLQQSFRQMKEKERFVQALIDADPDGIRVINDRFEIVKANKAYREQLGHEEKELPGLTCYRSSHGRTEPCPPTLETCPLHELEKTDKPLKTRHRHVKQDGTPLWVEVYAAPLTVESEGEQKRYIVESIRSLADTIKYSHEQKLSSIGQLAAGVAHEVHNPLAAVRVALQSSLRSIKENEIDVDRFRHYLELLDQQVDKCVEVTERLMKLSVFPDQLPTLIEINPPISETASLLGYEAEQRGVQVRLDLDTPSPRIIAVDGELRMLVLNMMQNAFHAMPDGGELAITSRQLADKVEITFVDSGSGIPADKLNNIFNPFFSNRADKVQGTGLGLAIVKSIIDRYQGKIEVSSTPGEGTRFTIHFVKVDATH
nr:ATP-binding protein [Arenicellales bacterium]